MLVENRFESVKFEIYSLTFILEPAAAATLVLTLSPMRYFETNFFIRYCLPSRSTTFRFFYEI